MLVMVDEPGYLPCLKLAKGHPLSAIIANDKFPATADNRFAGLYYKLNMCKDDTVSLLTAGRVLEAVDGRDGRLHTGVHIVEPSATGKSRAVYECLTERYGMLLTCAPGDEYMKMGDVVWGLEQATRVTTPTARARHYAKVVASALLARLVVLRRILKQLGNAFTPSDWLRTQLRGDVGAGAILRKLSLQLQASPLSADCYLTRLWFEAEDWCKKTRRMGAPFNGTMPVVIDEAQELCSASNVATWKDLISLPRVTRRCNPYGFITHMIYTELVKFHSRRFMLVVAGTSFHLRDQDEDTWRRKMAAPSTFPADHLLKPLPRFATVPAFKSCATSLGFGAMVDVIADDMWQFAVDELQSRGRYIVHLLAEMCKGSPVLAGGAPPDPRGGGGGGGGAGAVAGAGDGGGTEGCGRGDLAAASGAAIPCAACDDNAPASFNATVVNAMFREAVLRARAVILRSRPFTRLEAKVKSWDFSGHPGIASTDVARLHLGLWEIAAFACLNASARGRHLQFYVGMEEHYGIHRARPSVGAVLVAAGVAVYLEDDPWSRTVHVCEPIVMLAVLKNVPQKVIIGQLLANWQSVAFVSPSINAYIYELMLCDRFKRLFARNDVAAIPELSKSAWAQRLRGKWRLQEAVVQCGSAASLSVRLHANCHTRLATALAPTHDTDGPDIAMLVTAAVPPAPAPASSRTATVAAPGVAGAAAVGDVAATAAPVVVPTATSGSGFGGKASTEECQLMLLVDTKLSAKYAPLGTMLRPTIGKVGKAAVGTTWQRQRVETEAPEVAVLRVVVDPVNRDLQASVRAMASSSSCAEWGGHSDFVWVMDKAYFDTHVDVATMFKRDMMAHLYLCAARRQPFVDGVDSHEQHGERKASKRAVETQCTNGGVNLHQRALKRARK